MKKAVFFVFLFGLLSLSLIAQTNLRGVVKDSETGEKLKGAHISEIKGDFKTVSGDEGVFKYKSPSSNHQIRVTYVGYDTLYMRVDLNRYKDGDLIVVNMKSSSYALDPVVTVATRKPDTVFQSKKVSVADFIFDGEELILLTYEKTPKHGFSLWWVDENNNPLFKQVIEGFNPEFNYNYKKEPYLLSTGRSYQIKTEDNELKLMEINRGEYNSTIRPVVAETEGALVFSTFNWAYPAFSYFAYSPEDTTYTEIISIEDKLTMEHYLAEYKFLDFKTQKDLYQKQLDTGIDKEIWAGLFFYVPNQKNGYKEPYGPLFKREDTLAVFDYYSDKMYLFDSDFNKLDSSFLDYHKTPRKSGWESQMVQDEINGKIYAVFQKAGYSFLKEVDLKSGQITELHKLHFKYVERIRVYDGYVYYIYRPFESAQKKFLYKERL